MTATTTFLCVDDDTTVLNALRTLLGNSLGKDVVLETAESGDEALEIHADLQQDGQQLAVVISDFIMPGMRGDELLVRLHERSPHTVKIMLTGQSDLEGVKRAINEANLYRFLEKPFNNSDLLLTAKSALRAYTQDRELERRNAELVEINNGLEKLVEKRTAELREKNQELERLSVTDRLTGLFNRLHLDRVLEEQLRRSQRYPAGFALVLLDIDHFKSVNDTYGHPVGDQVLMDVARLLCCGVREVDVVGRWGGEEFLIICPDTTFDGALATAEKLRERVAGHTFAAVGNKTSSFGVTAVRSDDTIPAMMARVDLALYRSKENGRNRVEGNI